MLQISIARFVARFPARYFSESVVLVRSVIEPPDSYNGGHNYMSLETSRLYVLKTPYNIWRI